MKKPEALCVPASGTLKNLKSLFSVTTFKVVSSTFGFAKTTFKTSPAVTASVTTFATTAVDFCVKERSTKIHPSAIL